MVGQYTSEKFHPLLHFIVSKNKGREAKDSKSDETAKTEEKLFIFPSFIRAHIEASAFDSHDLGTAFVFRVAIAVVTH